MVNASLKYQIFDWLDVTGRVKIDNYENRKYIQGVRFYRYTVCQETEEHISDTWAQSKNYLCRCHCYSK